MEFTPLLNSLSSLFNPQPLSIKKSESIVVMILSPHPDDECITSSLALRLALENNAQIINVAVTLGSNKSKQKQRSVELKNACQLLKIENVILSENWNTKEKELKTLIKKYRPGLIMAPHLKDVHPTHIKTGELLKKVLITFKKETFIIAWSEFWAPMSKPSILIEVPTEILKLQMEALTKHVGEVSRNPYHLRLPAWMMDNVRRGSELIGGAGAPATEMAFGVLYQCQLFKNGKFSQLSDLMPFHNTGSNLGYIFRLILDAASGSKTKVK